MRADGVVASRFRTGRIRLTRTAAERGPVLFGACGQIMTFHNPWHPSALPCASSRSEHGILGKRRVKLRSPAAGRTPRGCQPDEQIRPRLSGTLWSAAVRVRGSRAQRRGRSTTQLTSTEKMGTGVNGTYLSRVTVEDSVLDRFGHVDCRDLLGSFQVSDGAGHATDFVVRACAEAKLFDRFA